MSTLAAYLSQPCTTPGCPHTATYRVTWDESMSGTKARITRIMCDLHAYQQAEDAGATIWALND